MQRKWNLSDFFGNYFRAVEFEREPQDSWPSEVVLDGSTVKSPDGDTVSESASEKMAIKQLKVRGYTLRNGKWSDRR
jgi:hypothetical protein